MSKHYPETTSSPNFPEIEKKIQKFWLENNIFQKSVENLPDKKNNGKEFSFFDGPPFANGLPHYGHLLTSCVKDLYARYHTMTGEHTERVFGWDCHGLPAEMEAEKELGIQGQIAIQEYGIEKFNNTCRTSVMKYTSEWKEYVNRVGRWVDFDNGYKTMDKNYIESVIWAFSELYKKGLVYEGHKVMPYSWAAETPLSNFETRLDNAYREKISKAITVAFELEEESIVGLDISVNKVFVLAWTTTPWTLPSNLALAVGKDVKYKAIRKGDNVYILSGNAVAKYFDEADIEVLSTMGAEKLVGLKYKPLLPYFAGEKYTKQRGAKAFTILEGDFVSDADGTGIVHLAPGFGEDDQRVCQENGICLPDSGGIICPVDEAGKFTADIFDIPELKLYHLNVIAETNKSEDEPYKEDQLKKYGLANLRIVKYLKNSNQVIKEEDYKHNYPHCWRTDTPLIYRAIPSWYVKVTAFKDRMVELNQKINWIPDHIRDGQFGKWLENAHDWAISRNRFWGAPIPIWRSNDPQSKKLYVFGSIKEIEEFFGTKVNDLHRPYIDELTKPDPENPKFTIKRVPEVLDCWFESGSMPFAQFHYPFENQDKFKSRFPADFIVEYSAQTRGWFYTLMVLSTALFDEIPFKNCICHGVILGEPMKNPNTGAMEKQKLSKRLKNYPDPVEVFNTLGADAMRWMMISSPVMNGGELTISKSGDDIKEIVRLVLKPIWNAYHFFCLYANSDGIKAEINFSSENLLDKYILAKLKNAVEQIKSSLDSYNTQTACKAVEDFFEVLNNWYIRRSRERFWESNESKEKISAYSTLYTCLVTLCQAASPLMPFTSEEIFKGLTGKESVHLEKFPDVSKVKDESELISSMDFIRDVCNTALSIRNKENIRVRQPLGHLTIVSKIIPKELEVNALAAAIIADEINVKGFSLDYDINKYAEHKLKINFPVLGKRLPDKVKQIIPASKANQWEKLPDGRVKIADEILEKEECELLLEPKDKKGASALSTNDALVILDLNLTPELIEEGIARDVVRLIQQARKEADLNISDRINLSLKLPENYKQAVAANNNYICEQTLANSLDMEGNKLAKFSQSYEIEKDTIEISLAVVG